MIRRKEVQPTGAHPIAVAEGVHQVRTGMGRMSSHVYLVESGPGWVLVDAGWPGAERVITAAAESLFGTGARPAAIVLTHIHPDHTGAAPGLARKWDVPVYVHPDELPLARGVLLDEYANPLDRWVLRPLMMLLPKGTLPATDMTGVVRILEPGAGVPGLPDWRCVPTPGHTPGHIALFRESDRVLLTGDAVLATDVNSVRGLLTGGSRVSGPPWIATWDRPTAEASIAALARLRPRLLASGHGPAVSAPQAARQLEELAARVTAARRPGLPIDYQGVAAVRVGGPEVLEVIRRRLRAPRRGEARVRVEACSVSAVDVQARKGLSTYPPRFPFVPGYAVVGVVDAVGAGVTAVAAGDRVVVMTEKGGYAEYIFVSSHPMMGVSAGLDAGEVVAVGLNYLVAHQTLSRVARIRRGQAILVTGAAGGIGTALIQLGQLLQLRIYGADLPSKHPWLVDHGVVPLGARAEDAVKALQRMEPDGVDAVLDGRGGDWVRAGLAVLRPGGVLVEYANPGSPASTFKLMVRAIKQNLVPKGKRIRLYGTTSWRLDRKPLMDAWATLYELLEARKIAPVIAGRFPLLDARQAHLRLEDGDVVGNLALVAGSP
ncbi:NADPH:quinone reductase-like Zn-dependent oxidoreductase [Arthrobacter sp. SLBN-100]|uniref:MBL fold metallo-hydrolase n=1 Tax=Arthrobacter sp. SLBN-100 TaxID=2768450 RepID=UPI00114DFD0A|nr:MBL fold metallo-hydrolase [Arthrobacter sp. SLBN-100]TQJ67838.1 NADPH:quinone reductase-like Zn-dependent oxidoreductase [Arthrobacter sp. SLBN-100]